MSKPPDLPKEGIFSRSNRNALLSKFDLTHLLICFLLIVLFITLLASGRMERMENLALDYFFRSRPSVASHPDIAVIEIDKESIQTIGAWPWPWRYHTQITKLCRIGERGPLFLTCLFQKIRTAKTFSVSKRPLRNRGVFTFP